MFTNWNKGTGAPSSYVNVAVWMVMAHWFIPTEQVKGFTPIFEVDIAPTYQGYKPLTIGGMSKYAYVRV